MENCHLPWIGRWKSAALLNFFTLASAVALAVQKHWAFRLTNLRVLPQYLFDRSKRECEARSIKSSQMLIMCTET